MIAKDCTIEHLNRALDKVNERFNNNITWKRRPERIGNRFRFTLTVKSSREPGSRISHNFRRIAAACWHVHGHFFDELIKLAPNVEIQSNGNVINRFGGNWQDKNIGSINRPLLYSEACNCGYSEACNCGY